MTSSTPSQFEGKVVLVTGASSGIGEDIAIAFAQRGASVTLWGRDKTRLEEARLKCVQGSGGHENRFLIFSGNVNDQACRTKAVENTVTTFGRLDILITSAGEVRKNIALANATEEDYDLTMNSLAKSVLFTIQAAVTHLEKSSGNVVIVSSDVTRSFKGYPVYGMAKAAVEFMAKNLALDLAPKGIRVNCVNPSYVSTRICRNLGNTEEESAQVDAFCVENESKTQPLGQRLVTLKEISDAVVFLASDSASFISGEKLFVDGCKTL